MIFKEKEVELQGTENLYSEWNKITAKLKASGYNLSKIRISFIDPKKEKKDGTN